MTEIEFESLLQLAFRDSKNVPDEINQKLKKKLYKKSRYKRILKSVPISAAACLVIGGVVASVMFNVGGNSNNDMISKPITANETQNAVTMEMARGAIEENKSIDCILIDSLDNNIEKLMTVSESVKSYMEDNSQYAFYEDFKGLSGNERCYFEESGELVVIFDAGTVAPEEHGEIFINVGIIE